MGTTGAEYDPHWDADLPNPVERAPGRPRRWHGFSEALTTWVVFFAAVAVGIPATIWLFAWTFDSAWHWLVSVAALLVPVAVIALARRLQAR